MNRQLKVNTDTKYKYECSECINEEKKACA